VHETEIETRVYSEDDMEEVMVRERETGEPVNDGVTDMVVITGKGSCVRKQGLHSRLPT
jgi:hypothetical protein